MNAETKKLPLTDHQLHPVADVRAELLRTMLVHGNPEPLPEQLLRGLRRLVQRPRTAAVTAIVATLGALNSADGAVITWSNALGGSASTAANWSPSQVPSATDDWLFNLNATYTVTLNATVPGSLTQTYREGAVTLTLTNPHTVSNSLLMGTVSGDTRLLALTTGTFTVNGATTVGNVTGSDATLNVNDDDADLIVGNGADLTIGNNGSATMNITGGGLVRVADQFLAGSSSSSTVDILISGFTVAPISVSQLDVDGTSQSRIGAGGDVTMLMENGGVASFGGDLVVANGSASQSSITVEDTGLLPSRLNVTGDLLLGRNSSGVAAGVGSLVVNDGGIADVGDVLFVGSDPDGGTGLLDINAGGVVDADTVTVGVNGDLLIDAGTLTAANGITNMAGGLIGGAGVINADIFNSGLIQASGTGLTVNGTLFNTNSNLITGTKLHFGNGGGYEGSGTCQVDISGETGALIRATGTLSIGDTTTSGFSYNGELEVGGHVVTLVDSNQAVLGGETTIDSGRIECLTGIGVQNGATLRGDGLLVGNVVMSGVLDPDSANPSFGGLITVQGDLLMNPTGVVDIELGGVPGSSANDRVNISGAATFGGKLRLRIADGLIPYPGMQFIAVNAAGGRTGQFNSIELVTPAPCHGVTFILVYTTTAAIVLVRPPNADTVRDGVVNVQDLLAVVGAWGPWQDGMPIGEVDGVDPVNVADLLYVIGHWGCQP